MIRECENLLFFRSMSQLTLQRSQYTSKRIVQSQIALHFESRCVSADYRRSVEQLSDQSDCCYTATVFRIVPLPSTKRHLEAFNDLALQWADATLLSSQSAAFWEGSESEKDQNFSSRDDREGKVAGTKTNATSELRQKQDQLERDLIAALSRVSV